MPSSKDRQRVEVPIYLYEQLAQIARRRIADHQRLNQLLFQALQSYRADMDPQETSQPLQWACSAGPLPRPRGGVNGQ